MFTYVLLAASLVAADPLPDGTLLFLENCNKFVEVFTATETGHVAMVFDDRGTSWVYEATPDQVRRMTLEEYYADLARINERRKHDIKVLAYRPAKPYPRDEVASMRAFLDEQLGRRYSLKNYVSKEVSEGTHCAELTGNTLNHSARFDLTTPCKNSPAALREKISCQYSKPEVVQLPAYTSTETWCQRTSRRWHEFALWCRWSCGEVVAFCW